MKSNHKVSIIIPFRKRTPFLDECLKHIALLSYQNREIILIPDDLEDIQYAGLELKVIASGPVGPAKKRDQAAKIATGDILAFIDDDAYPAPQWLSMAVKHFSNDKITAVTGPAATPHSNSFWQKASGLIYENKFCGGHTTYRYTPEKLKEVDDAASVNFLVRKKDYFEVEGFNTHYYPGEDTKLCLDLITKLDKKIIYEPKALVWHHRRSLFKQHLKQVEQYALHRGFFMKKFPKTSLKFQYFLPTLFLIYILILPGLLLVSSKTFILGLFPLVLYILLFGLALVRKASPLLGLTTIVGGLLTHMTYGFNLIRGLLSTELKR